MEPALLGLDDGILAAEPRRDRRPPQWSQPCSGWMTGEPAAEDSAQQLAAMEPALLGLDDATYRSDVERQFSLPQWSQPCSGWMTGSQDTDGATPE